MTCIKPQFASIYKIEHPTDFSQFKDVDAYTTGLRNFHDAISFSPKEPINVKTGSDLQTFRYGILFPNGDMALGGDTADKPGHTTAHILSGIRKEEEIPFLAFHKFRFFDVSTIAAVDNRWVKTPLTFFKNLINHFILKKAPITIEAACDEQVEARLKALNIPYEKIAFQKTNWYSLGNYKDRS